MNIALHDGDQNGFPNFALMKISAWHKAHGDTVSWLTEMMADTYDMVYSSKVFTFTPESPYLPENTIKGGTGYGLYNDLPQEIDQMFPDYSIYPQCGHAIGFLTRGCIRKCPWCCVPKKEGSIRPYTPWEQIKRADSRDMVLMDNNVLACEYGIEQIERMAGRNIRVDFNQGLDARLITPEIAKKLAALKWFAPLRMACDTKEMLPVVGQATAYLREAGCTPKNYFVYVLLKDDYDEVETRVKTLDVLGLDPFVQPYIDFVTNKEPCQKSKDFARWVNDKAIFRTVKWFDEYKPRKGM